MEEKKFKTGFVSIIGRPNVGKSTLLNKLLGTKISIVTPVAQTTRDRIAGIFNSDAGQIIFYDTPGYHTSKKEMNNYMNRIIFSSSKDSDVILFVVPCNEWIGENDRFLLEKIIKFNTPVILVVTKIDLLEKENVEAKEKEWRQLWDGWVDIVKISSPVNKNLDQLIEKVYNSLPYSDIQYYPIEQITDRTNKFIIKELIREEILIKTKQEIPHSSAVLIEKYEDREKTLYINATIFVERNSQKPILIGKSGSKLKSIGTDARIKIQDFLHCKVYLELYIKVKEDWTRSGSLLKKMGYDEIS
ncbi:GTPase Era [Spiroplasma endosymbiont of Aspidapion aeneum]|uniref:GTPase Era n=1 Tax=Spiroplasma endosymbiont of Aspidapion aeneum TaxID=3066276 RepID=UPI00313EB85A